MRWWSVVQNRISQAVIIAGGMGTRLAPFTNTMPKPMYPFNGRPFIGYLIEQVKEFGIHNIVILLGYLPEIIRDYLGDGSEWGVNIEYDVTPVDYNTADRITHAKELLDDEFLFMYCDNYCPVDFGKLQRDFYSNNSDIQVSVYSNKDGYTKNNIRFDEGNGKIIVYDKTRMETNLAGVDIGYAIVKKEVLDLVESRGENFEQIVYPKLVQQGTMYATVTDHRYYSVGSWERIKLTEEFFNIKKVVFLDRDGTINVRAPKACYIETPEEFQWLPNAKTAIKMLNDHGYVVILVSNQPGIARGNLTHDILKKIHEKMQSELLEIGAHIDHIYYCPHDWDEGCECRKPKPGMLYQAQKDLSIDLTKSILIGDDDRDIQAGKSAGCICYKVDTNFDLYNYVCQIVQNDKRE